MHVAYGDYAYHEFLKPIFVTSLYIKMHTSLSNTNAINSTLPAYTMLHSSNVTLYSHTDIKEAPLETEAIKTVSSWQHRFAISSFSQLARCKIFIEDINKVTRTLIHLMTWLDMLGMT